MLKKNQHAFSYTAKWPDLEAQVKSWKTDHGHNGFFCVYKDDHFRIKKWTC